MLGRFLEISLPVTDILASLEFYERLGFTQTATGESWPHPYAVVGDGRLFLGLHQAAFPGPTVTYVQPDLAFHIARLKGKGLEAASAVLGSEDFNRATFIDPAGHQLLLVEARTFSPPPESCPESVCGYFSELGMPVREFSPMQAWWEMLGFVALDAANEAFVRRSLTSDRLNIGLYRTRAWRQPVLTFEDTDMKRRLDLLRRRGVTLSDEMPDALDAGENAVLIAPEGTRLLLMTAGTVDPIQRTGIQ